MTQSRPPSPSAAMITALREAAEGKFLDARRFVETALFAPDIGYYRKTGRPRVGRDVETDFYTAESLGRTFDRLVLAAIRECLGTDLRTHHFIELGEPREARLVEAAREVFLEARSVGISESAGIPDHSVLFLHEILDAQPFQRFRFDGKAWRIRGINPFHDAWEEMDRDGTQTQLPGELPPAAPEGYIVDFPVGAGDLLRSLVEPDWRGLVVIFDYGLQWETMIHERPRGTARTYYRHQTGSHFWQAPGEQDITHHLVWDFLESILKASGFSDIRLERQEAFFMNHAREEMASIFESDGNRFSREKQALSALIHPQHFGSKFQVLTAIRS